MAGSEFPFEDGYDITAAGQNAAHQKIGGVSLIASGKNVIRQLIDRSVTTNSGEFAEAYTASAGRLTTVDTVNTDAIYDADDDTYSSNITPEAGSDTLHNPDSFSDTANAFDFDYDTYATKSEAGDPRTVHFGTTFAEKTIGTVLLKLYVAAKKADYEHTRIIMKLQSYDGSDWNNEETLYDSGTPEQSSNISKTYTGAVTLNKDVEGVRVELTAYGASGGANPHTFRVYVLDYGADATAEIIHDLPSGTFSEEASAMIGIPLYFNNTGSVKYKLTNAGEDTGWINVNSFETFTPLTSEPTKLTVQLEGGISILGFAAYELKESEN